MPILFTSVSSYYLRFHSLFTTLVEIHIQVNEYLANEYSIADIATFPWIARHPIHDIGLKNHKNLLRWYDQISHRPAVLKGYDLFKDGSMPPSVN